MFMFVTHAAAPLVGFAIEIKYSLISPTRHAVMPADTLMGAGNSPVRHLRHMVVAEYGTTLKLIKGRIWISAKSGRSSKMAFGFVRFILLLLGRGWYER